MACGLTPAGRPARSSRRPPPRVCVASTLLRRPIRSPRGSGARRRTVMLRPVPTQAAPVRALLDAPGDLQPPVRVGERAVPQGVGGQRVQRHAHRHCKFRRQRDPGPLQGKTAALVVGVELGPHQLLERGGLGDVLGDERVRPASDAIRPDRARVNSGTVSEERTVALSTACTVASVFFTRLGSSRTMKVCRPRRRACRSHRAEWTPSA